MRQLFGSWKFWTLVTVLLALAGTTLYVEYKARNTIVVSKDTTFVTSPLRPDGSVDFVAAFNEQARPRVAPEENAAVPFLQAVGPSKIPATVREQYFKLIGIPPLPEKGPYFVPFEEFVEPLIAKKFPDPLGPPGPAGLGPPPGVSGSPAEARQNEGLRLSLLLDEASRRPWSKREFPEAAAWLDANNAALDLVISGLGRPGAYLPLVAESNAPGMIMGASAMLLPIREVPRALAARAMLRLQVGRVEDAWQDALACHLLARRINGMACMIRLLVADMLDGIACQVDWAIAERGNLTASQAKRMQADLARLPPLPSAHDAMFEEHLEAVDAICGLQGKITAPFADWNHLLRIFNSWFDRYTDALDKPTYLAQTAALGKLEAELRSEFGRLEDLKGIDESKLALYGTQRLSGGFIATFLPSLRAICSEQADAAVRFDLSNLALALAAYHADHGKYPEHLNDLTPKYIATVPRDPFNGDPLHYKRQPKGFLLYSVGRNEKDDGGRDSDSDPGEQYDDIVVRVPYQPPKSPDEPPKMP